MSINNNDQLENLLKNVSSKLGVDKENLKKSVQSGDISKAINNLDPKDANRLQKVLSDKEAAQKLLSTPQAQQLLKKFVEGKNNGWLNR